MNSDSFGVYLIHSLAKNIEINSLNFYSTICKGNFDICAKIKDIKLIMAAWGDFNFICHILMVFILRVFKNSGLYSKKLH